MEKIERLDDVYNDEINDDNAVIIRVLNTILERTEDSYIIYELLMHHKMLFEELYKTSKINRLDIKFIIDKMNYMILDRSFDNYIKIIEVAIKQDMTQYKNIWIMCYLRTIFENMYAQDILYKKPEYAVKISLGENPYYVFLDSLDKKDYIYIKNDQ
jgi:hypothetical protein